jgi:hypothetical protein
MSRYKITFKVEREGILKDAISRSNAAVRDFTEGFWVGTDYKLQPPLGEEYLYIMPHHVVRIELIPREEDY